MLNKRIIKIVDVLLKQNTYITIDRISEELQVSNKTIRNDLQLVEEWLDEYNLVLVKKTGVGVLIEGAKADKLYVLAHIQEKNKSVLDYSPLARKIFIGMQLCAYDNCRIYELSRQLYVSRATIHKDILSLGEVLKTYNILLHRKNNNGISIEGKERNIRNFLLELMIRDNGYMRFIEIIRNDQYLCDGSLIFPGLETTDDEIKDFMSCVLSSNNSYINSLTFQSLILVLLRVYITYLRIQDHHHVNLSPSFLDELTHEPFYKETQALCDRIGNHYRIQFLEIELRYLQVYFLSLQNSDDLNVHDKAEAKRLSDLLLCSWSEQLRLPFENDDELRMALYTHLCPAITRFRHGIPNENPLLSEIHNLYSKTFEVTKHSISCIEEYFRCTVSDDEVGYLALHLAASIERMKKPLRCIIVAHHGIGAGNLLKEKITAQIPEVVIIAQESFFSIYERTFDDIDLIISTLPLQLVTDTPVLQVNSLLHDYDILRLKDTIKEFYNKKNNPLSFKIALHN